MDENTKIIMQLANFFAQQNAVAAATAAISNGPGNNVNNNSIQPLNNAASSNAMAELAKQLLINTASNLIPHSQTAQSQTLPQLENAEAQQLPSQQIQSQQQVQQVQQTPTQQQQTQQMLQSQQFQQSQQQQLLQLAPQLIESLTSTSVPSLLHSTSDSLSSNINQPIVASQGVTNPTLGASNLGNLHLDGTGSNKRIFGEKGCFTLPYILQKRLRPPREKMKRGPKEKDFFRCFLFCLPDMYAKMPKFTSCDPLEQEIVRSYQMQGYGFPAQDYMDGTPRKTYLCLKQNQDRFLQFLTTIYPVLEGKKFELYRVDRQRNLIRLDNRTPRAIKDTKYQGTIILIPFNQSSYDGEPTEPNRFDVNSEIQFSQNSIFINGSSESNMFDVNSDSRCSQGNSNSPPLEIVQTVGNASFASTEDEQSYGEMSVSHMSFDEQRIDEENHHRNQYGEFYNSNGPDLFTQLINARNQLTSMRNISLPSKSSLVEDVFQMYRYDDDICNCCLNLASSEDVEPGDSTASLQAKMMFCTFWKKILHKHFSGSFEKYPIVCAETGGDLFEILGKILLHGLLLYGYWPIHFAKASACYVLTQVQNQNNLLKSFMNTLSEFELSVVNAAMKEARMLPPKFSKSLEERLITVLGKYGILNVPAPCDLTDTLQRIAQTILIQRPYWALVKLSEGSKKFCTNSVLNNLTEFDVDHLYQTLIPDPATLIEKLQYEHCDINDEATYLLETKVRKQLEVYLWSISRKQLELIVERWCGCDCLIAPKYYVTFSSESSSGAQFDSHQCLLVLSRRLVTHTEIADAVNLATQQLKIE